jgi:hypothetical protein
MLRLRGGRACLVVIVLLLGGRVAAGAEVLDAACLQRCQSEPEPPCATCESPDVCAPLFEVDRGRWDACVAEHQACWKASGECMSTRFAGDFARRSCDQGDAGCCARACTWDPDALPLRSARTWWYFDGMLTGILRRTPGDSHFQVGTGLLVEALVGPRRWRGTRVPFRLGPFAQVAVNYEADEDATVQLAGGLTALLYGSDTREFRPTWLLSGGVLYDVPPTPAENRVGYLGRLSAGVTTFGKRPWKMFSLWLYLEGHYIPGGGAQREEVILGLRLGPLIIPVVFGGYSD